MSTGLNIISFDVPYPANYGGVIDVYYKLKYLQDIGVTVYLHCFEYGRGKQTQLEQFCKKVYYYKRNTSLLNHFRKLPYIVVSRKSNVLLNNLLQNDFPVLFEGLHTCLLLDHPTLKNRYKIFRESNIEHEYYRHLARAEKNLLKQVYFKLEAKKLERFEPIVKNAQLMLTVSKKDTSYFSAQYPENRVEYLPSFHPNDKVTSLSGRGDYILYHGNLSVPENETAAIYLIQEVFSRIAHPVIIAGLNPPETIKELIKYYPNISLQENPDEERMKRLIAEAQVHCLYTHQATGLKLKLLNVLYAGRFCVCNAYMLHGTDLNGLCTVADTPEAIGLAINTLMSMNFSEQHIEQRRKMLAADFDNDKKALYLRALIG